jgi:hypothetical protein
MEPRTGLRSTPALSAEVGPLPALVAQVTCLQKLVAELLVKNECLRQALAAQARAEQPDLQV